MLRVGKKGLWFEGARGRLSVRAGDEVSLKLAMLIEGQCEGAGATAAARKFGFSKQRYYQLLRAFGSGGAAALQSAKRGPKKAYRRTAEVVRQVIRHRFLDADASAAVIAQKLRQDGWKVSARSVERVIAEFGVQKKLHAFRPEGPCVVETQHTRATRRAERCDPASLERGVRQLLADKVSGTMVGLWLLAPEHLRLGTWDLVLGWTRQRADGIEPRLALQLVHEAALCATGIRRRRGLSQKGFEMANGLPFIASDQAVHDLLDAHSVAEAQHLQVVLGKLRRASGHYRGRLLSIDPHHIRSHTQRLMRRRKGKENEPAVKTLQTYFCLDADTRQPLAFTIGSPSRNIAHGGPELLGLAHAILEPSGGRPLVLADKEHYSVELFRHALQDTSFDLLVSIPSFRRHRNALAQLPPETFTRHWAGFATATLPFHFQHHPDLPLHQIIQRCGETADAYEYAAFLCTQARDEVHALLDDYPKRWHIEEFFNAHQALGWDRAGTLNLNIRYGHMTMALLAQTALHQFRQRLPTPFADWDAAHLADRFFLGLDGDIRVHEDTILVTFYNAPNADALRTHYEHLPKILEHERVDPRIPWLYNFKLDFRFK